MPPPLPAVLFPLGESGKYVTQSRRWKLGPWRTTGRENSEGAGSGRAAWNAEARHSPCGWGPTMLLSRDLLGSPSSFKLTGWDSPNRTRAHWPFVSEGPQPAWLLLILGAAGSFFPTTPFSLPPVSCLHPEPGSAVYPAHVELVHSCSHSHPGHRQISANLRDRFWRHLPLTSLAAMHGLPGGPPVGMPIRLHSLLIPGLF